MDLSDYSDYEIVLNRAKYFYGYNVELLPSTRLINMYIFEQWDIWIMPNIYKYWI